MKSPRTLALPLLICLALSAPAFAQEKTGACPEDENNYAEKGQYEAGGTLSGNWGSDLFWLSVSPTFGYFVADRFEISILGDLLYQNEKDASGNWEDQTAFELLVEPSYHHFLSDSVAVFGGVGVGVAFSAGRTAFDLAPRVGLNFEVGRSGVFSPQISVPILMGGESNTSDSSVTASLAFGAGFTTTF